jgi:hypothetical protein
VGVDEKCVNLLCHSYSFNNCITEINWRVDNPPYMLRNKVQKHFQCFEVLFKIAVPVIA